MAKIALSMSGMQKERVNLRLYQKVLPSLDLKRRQLMGEQKRAERSLAALEEQIESLLADVADQIPMLATRSVDISGIIAVKEIRRRVENVVGVRLPDFEGIEFEVSPYSLLGKPHWVDLVLERLKEFTALKVQAEIGKERAEILQHAVRKITQRVNLFEKRLIPAAEANIKKIQIYLSDAERTAVIQSKLSKGKRLAAARAAAGEEEATTR